MARISASRRRERRILAALPPVRIPTRMSDDPQRSPDWCHSHGCHRSACPGPH